MKTQLRFFWCWLTTGHNYPLNNWDYFVQKNGEKQFYKTCTKCSKKRSFSHMFYEPPGYIYILCALFIAFSSYYLLQLLKNI